MITEDQKKQALELQEKYEQAKKECHAEISKVLKKHNLQLAVDPNSTLSNPLIILI